MTLLLRVFQRYIPDPLVLAIFLTGIVAVLSLILTPSDPVDVAIAWGDGFSALLTFTMQMVLMLLGGLILADTRVIRLALSITAGRVRTARQAVIAVTLVSSLFCWINWGLGLVVGAFFAVAVARQLRRSPFALLVASSYSGFLVWHGGLSGSIPLSVNTPSNPMEHALGRTIPISETLFSGFNIAIVLALLMVLPALNWWMLRWGEEVELPATSVSSASAAPPSSPAERWERQYWPSLLVALLGIVYLGGQWLNGSFQLDLNRVNIILYILAFTLHGSVKNFMDAVESGAAKVGAVLVQYPLYGGIMGIITKAGLAAVISQSMTQWTTAETLPLFTFLSAGVLNIFIPSGGGQWAVQGPIAIEAAKAMGADLPKVVMSVAWGDAWTNMIQPFWALPVLAIGGLKARDIMGFCFVVTLVSGAIIGTIFYLM